MDAELHARHLNALKVGFDGDVARSIEMLQDLVDEFPTEVEPLYDLAMTQMLVVHIEEACANLHAVLRKNPNHSKALQQVTYC